MKKYLLIAGILCAIVATPACAVNNNPTTSPSSGTNGQLNWATTSGGVSIQGGRFVVQKMVTQSVPRPMPLQAVQPAIIRIAGAK